MSEHKIGFTTRGFGLLEFKDHYGAQCSLQNSSLATDDAVWFGVCDPEPKVMASQAAGVGVDPGPVTTGWVDYPLPEEVHLTTRMHLTRGQVEQLLPILQRFVNTGSITDDQEEDVDES